MNFFELNEELKEKLVLDHGATFAKTEFFKSGVLLLPEPFYETIVIWENGLSLEVAKNVLNLVNYYREEINEEHEMTEILFETNKGKPSILWSIFPEKYPNYD
jgi:hypothetical protein